MAYKYKQMVVRIRWVDYVRIRSLFPAYRYESASSYFARLAMKLKELKEHLE